MSAAVLHIVKAYKNAQASEEGKWLNEYPHTYNSGVGHKEAMTCPWCGNCTVRPPVPGDRAIEHH